jgi:hypothetical protein
MPVLDPIMLIGTGVRLEPLSRAHVSGLARAAGSGLRDSYAFTRVPTTEAEATACADDALALQAAGRALPCATIDRSSGRVVGSAQFLNVELWAWPAGSPFQRDEHLPDVVEIGATWLAPAAQRTAINTEANLLMLTHASHVIERAVILTDGRRLRLDQALSIARPRPPHVSVHVAGTASPVPLLTDAQIRRLERENIQQAIARTDGRIYGRGGAAGLLGLKPTTLAYRMKALGIRRP